MRSVRRAVLALCLGAVAAFPLAAGADEAPSLSVVEATTIATEAYICGVPNSIKRCDLAQRDTLITNPDGSVDMYLQATSPSKDKEANWLPAPKGKFNLVLRIYTPRGTAPSILDGTWTPPPVQRAQ